MMCEHAKELIAASWLRELNEAGELALRNHMEECSECASDGDSLGAMWERLGDLPASEPGRGLDLRFEDTLRGFAATGKPQLRYWPALAAAAMLAGLLIGGLWPRHDNEIAQLRREVESTRALVALSLLQQQSPSQRLKGIDYSGRMTTLEPEIVQALIQAVNEDPSTNVRLAAIDALGKASGSGDVLKSLTRSLPAQDSPMVQAALIDYLVDARDRQAVGTLREFGKRADLNPTVLDRTRSAVNELSQ